MICFCGKEPVSGNDLADANLDELLPMTDLAAGTLASAEVVHVKLGAFGFGIDYIGDNLGAIDDGCTDLHVALVAHKQHTVELDLLCVLSKFAHVNLKDVSFADAELLT